MHTCNSTYIKYIVINKFLHYIEIDDGWTSVSFVTNIESSQGIVLALNVVLQVERATACTNSIATKVSMPMDLRCKATASKVAGSVL